MTLTRTLIGIFASAPAGGTHAFPLRGVLLAAVATGFIAAGPAAALTRITTEASSGGSIVTQATGYNGPTVPHRPETDIHFPRR